jgi:hypothetical protein
MEYVKHMEVYFYHKEGGCVNSMMKYVFTLLIKKKNVFVPFMKSLHSYNTICS